MLYVYEGDAGQKVMDPDDELMATDPDEDTLTYTLLTGTRSFEIDDPATGQLTTKVALDHETEDKYTVEVGVSDLKDDEGEPDTVDDDKIVVIITVRDVNEAPMFLDANDDSIMEDTRSVKENQAGGTPVGAPVVATDAENDALKYTLGGPDVGSFNIGESDGQLTTKDALASGTKTVIVSVSDGKDANDMDDPASDTEITVTITIEEVETTNNAPAFPATETGARSVPEGEVDQLVGAPVEATDADSDTLIYTLNNVPGSIDADSFEIDPATGQLTTAVVLDHEIKDEYTVTVTATDDDADNPFADTIMVTITVTDVNEKPTFPTATNMLYVYEGDAGQKVVDPDEELMATDPEENTLTYSLGNVPGSTDADSFEIDPATGQLTTKVALDYEDDPVLRTYTVIVSVSDGRNADGGTDPASDDITTVTINLTDVTEEDNNPPRFIADTATADTAITEIALEVMENAGDDMTLDRNVGDVILAKDDDSSDTLSYTLGGADADSFTIESAADRIQLKTAVVLDDETEDEYMVTITVSDGAADATITVTVTVTPVDETQNRAPAFASATATRSIPEDTAVDGNVGAAVTATDADNDELMYTLGGTR